MHSEITPKPRPDPLLEDDDDADDHLAQRAGYTPLIIRKMEPDHSSEYAKPNIRPEADNKQGEFNSACILLCSYNLCVPLILRFRGL